MKNLLDYFRKSNDAELRERFRTGAEFKQAQKVRDDAEALKKELSADYTNTTTRPPQPDKAYRPKHMESDHRPEADQARKINEQTRRYQAGMRAIEDIKEDAFKQIGKGKGQGPVDDVRTRFAAWREQYEREQETQAKEAADRATVAELAKAEAADPLLPDPADTVRAAVEDAEVKQWFSEMTTEERALYDRYKALNIDEASLDTTLPDASASWQWSVAGNDDGRGL